MKIARILALERKLHDDPPPQTMITTGFPSPAEDYLMPRISLDQEFIKHPLSTFFVSVEGYSMINAFIPPKATLIVDRSLTPKNSDIVLAIVNGEFKVRFLKKNDYKSWLVPANSKFQEVEITPDEQVQIWGVVTAIVTAANDVARCML